MKNILVDANYPPNRTIFIAEELKAIPLLVGDIEVFTEDVQRLRPRIYLNDVIINISFRILYQQYLNSLQPAEDPKVIVVNSYFTEKIEDYSKHPSDSKKLMRQIYIY